MNITFKLAIKILLITEWFLEYAKERSDAIVTFLKAFERSKGVSQHVELRETALM